MTTTMRSFHLPSSFGPPSTYILGLLPKPVVSTPDNILIKVHAASLNPIDMRYAEGTMKLLHPNDTFPTKIGYDTSGVISDLGEAAKSEGWKVGDEVFVRLPHEHRGSLSEYALTTTEYVARKPRNLTHVQAAGLPLVAMTGLQAIKRIEGGLEGIKGKRVFVTAGMGGAGSVGVQLMKALGAGEVITTVSGSKMNKAKELFNGVVDRFIDYKTESPATAIAPRSLDFIYDTAGGNVIPLFPLLKENHKMVSIAAMPTGDALRQNSPDAPWYLVQGLNLYAWWKTTGPARKAGVVYEFHRLRSNGKDLDVIRGLAEEGKVKPVIGEVFGFSEEECRKASEIVMGKGSQKGGKVVIKIVDDEN